jgi:hypothetical protein
MTNQAQDHTQLQQSVDRNVRTNMILMAVFALLTFSFIGYQYYRFTQVSSPEVIVSVAEEQIKEHYHEIREDLKEQLVSSAPELAETISERAVKELPEARKDLVQFLGRQLAVGLDRATAFSADEFREILRENRDLIEKAVTELKEFPDEAKEFVTAMEKRLEKRWDVDVRKQARFVLKVVRGVNAKLERLNSNENLTPEEMIERRIVRIIRAMQEQEPDTKTARANSGGE